MRNVCLGLRNTHERRMVMKHFVLLTLMAIMMLSSTLSADIHETVLLQVALSPSREVPIVTDRTASGNAVIWGIHLTQVTPTSCGWAHGASASQSATIDRYGVGSTATACCTRR